jgi:hypothetical protein
MNSTSIAAALGTVTAAIIEAEAGPERITAIDPAEASTDWETLPDQARADKMRQIWHAVRSELRELHVLHKLPQVLLVADDGACIELFGGHRTGTAVVIPDWPEGQL